MCMISVVTSVYNCEEYIGQTIDSVINQTINDWEYILIDDNSSDRSFDIIENIAKKDSRIKVIKNTENKGQCVNLNFGIKMAKGKYIARLDHDDICHPKRFEKQLEYMENNPEVALVGSWINIWKNGKIEFRKFYNYPVKTTGEARLIAISNNFMPHSSFFIRKSVMMDNDIWYDESIVYAEDYALLARLVAVGKVCLINEPLVTYRIFDGQSTNRYSIDMRQKERQYIIGRLLDETGYSKYEILKKAGDGLIKNKKDYEVLGKTLIRISKDLKIGNKYKDIVNNRVVQLTYFFMCFYQKEKNLSSLISYMLSDLRYRGWYKEHMGISYAVSCIGLFKPFVTIYLTRNRQH